MAIESDPIADPSPLLAAGERLGSYVIESLVGRGGMGEVYLAYDERLQRPVAIKRIRQDRVDGEHRERFRREALAVAQVSHPAIVQVYEWLETPGGHCLVMEWIGGRSLAEVIAAGELDLRRILRLACEIAEGLAEAHAKGFLHRDLKPENVLVTASGHAKIVDFGLVAPIRPSLGDAETALTRAGAVVGTVHTMAPEQAEGGSLDHRADLFSFGCILYEMLAGRSPFRAATWIETLRKVLYEEPAPLARPDLPPALAELVRGLLAKDREGRPANAAAVHRTLEAILLGPEAAAGPAAFALPSVTADWPADGEIRVETAVRSLLRVVSLGRGDHSHGWEDTAYFEAVARSLRRLRQLVSRHGGIEVEKGDAFLALFERPADAVACALDHWQAVAELAAATGQPLAAGAVVHFGEVALRRSTPQEIARGARVIEVEGGAKTLAAQIGSVLSPGQILLSRAAFDLARQGTAASGSWGPGPAPSESAAPGQLRWLAHGVYLFEDEEDPVEIFEVGLSGRSPLAAPKDSSRARRVLSPNEEKMLGWRPAREQQIPFRSSWTLAERIGEGGFGEVWLARHASGERRVFKFCWEASRLRALKREVTLLGILRDALGNREDIARIFDWQFEQAPYFLELEYSAGGSLPDWAEAAGGLALLPLGERLELGAQVAEAVAAAHSVGVLHKDIKPANVLVVQGGDGRPKIKLADFGLGLLERGELIDRRGKSPYGFSFAFSEADSGAGTLGYLAPELVEGKAATVQADIYSLGVLIYQLAVGDFKRTLAPGWERGVADELLREDLASFVDGQPERRPASAREVAGKLRGLEERRQRRLEERRQQELAAAREVALAKAQHRRRWATFVAAAALLVLAVVALLALRAERAGVQAQLEAEKSEQVADFLTGLFVDLDPLESLGGKTSARELLDGGAARLAELADQPEVQARLEDAIGRAYWSLGELETAFELAQRAVATRERILGPDAVETARSRHLVGQVLCSRQQCEQGSAEMMAALGKLRRAAGYRDLIDDLVMTAYTVHVFRGDALTASRLLEEAVERAPRLQATPLQLLYIRQRLAVAKSDLGQLEEGIAQLREALRESRELPQAPLMAAIVGVTLAELEREAGRPEAALELAESSAAAIARDLGPEHAFLWVANATRGLALHNLGRSDEARQILAAGVERDRRQGDRSLLAVYPLMGRAWTLHDEGRCAEAEIPLREALQISQTGQLDQDDYPAAFLHSLQASCLGREGKRNEALELFQRSIPRLEKRMPNAPETRAAKAWRSAVLDAGQR